jgi:hypothetical protein
MSCDPYSGHLVIVQFAEETNKMSKTAIRVLSTCSVLLLGSSIAISRHLNEKKLSFTVPAAPWTMSLPADDFVLKQEKFKPDGSSGYFFIVDEKKHLNVSFYIEPVGKCKTSKSCRDLVWKAGNPGWEEPQNVVLSEIGEVSFVEFLIPTFRGQPVQQQNMYAQFVVDGFWVDLHISKVLYTPGEHELFERLVKSIKFEPKKA